MRASTCLDGTAMNIAADPPGRAGGATLPPGAHGHGAGGKVMPAAFTLVPSHPEHTQKEACKAHHEHHVAPECLAPRESLARGTVLHAQAAYLLAQRGAVSDPQAAKVENTERH